jgi:aminoglycoside phosphotransferase (APT) family kinase protein
MKRGELLGSGRMADVFALDERRVLRRYRDGTDASGEAAVMAHVAAHGYPVPAVFPAAEGAGGGPDLVMERLEGPTMAAAWLAGQLTPERAGEILARLLNELHRVPARLPEDPTARPLHLDLHPENVLLTPRGPVVIDWANAAEGPPGYDRAVSALILAEVAVGAYPAIGELVASARRALASLLAHLDDAGGPADADDWPTHLARPRTLREANPTLAPGEKALLGEAVELVRAL